MRTVHATLLQHAHKSATTNSLAVSCVVPRQQSVSDLHSTVALTLRGYISKVTHFLISSLATAIRSLPVTLSLLAGVCLTALCGADSAHAYTLAPPQYRSAPQPQYQNEQERLAAEQAAKKKAAEEAHKAAELAALQARTPDPEKELAELNAITTSGEVPLLLYGGNNNSFLGCLNCNFKLRISVWNKQGPYGSVLSTVSIWNQQYEFGNEASPLCPWNPYASTPPVVVDTNGNFYGFFTANTNQQSRFNNNFVATIFRDHNNIASDSSLYYQQLFAEHQESKTIPLELLEALPPPLAPDDMLLAPRQSDFLPDVTVTAP